MKETLSRYTIMKTHPRIRIGKDIGKICNKDINHRNLAPTCINGSCRGKWYRIQYDIKKINKAIELNNFNDIDGYSIKKLQSLGFNVTILQNDKNVNR